MPKCLLRQRTRRSAFTSNIFTIDVGAGNTPFLVHSDVLCKSPTLRQMVKGEWKESTARRVSLEGWEVRTVEQLLEWLYSGLYTWAEEAPEE